MHSIDSPTPSGIVSKLARPTGVKPLILQTFKTEPPVIMVHRYQGRTLPCDGPSNCECCNLKMVLEERIMLPGYSNIHPRTIADLPTSVFWKVRDIGDLHGGLDKTVFHFSRENRQDNGKIVIKQRGVGPDDPRPEPFDFLGQLELIWASNLEFALSRATLKKNGPSDSPLLDDLPST